MALFVSLSQSCNATITSSSSLPVTSITWKEIWVNLWIYLPKTYISRLEFAIRNKKFNQSKYWILDFSAKKNWAKTFGDVLKFFRVNIFTCLTFPLSSGSSPRLSDMIEAIRSCSAVAY